MSSSGRDMQTGGHGDKGTMHGAAPRHAAPSSVRLLVSLSPYLLVPLSLFAVAGCNVIGAVAYKFSGSPTIKAQYAPPKSKTLVVVENYHNPTTLRLEADAVARHLVEEMKMHEVVPVVDPGAAEAHREAQGTAFRKMPIDAIGRALGAKQVIYVDLERFDLDQTVGSELLGGHATARVRVVGDGGEVLWPTDSAGGFPVEVKVDPQRVPAGTGEFGVRRQLHADLADRIAKLFYDWKADSADGASERFNG